MIIASKRVLLLAPPNSFLVNTRSVPRIGLLYLASVLRAAGHEVTVRHLASLDEFRDMPRNLDFIGISATTREYPKALQILNYCKRMAYPATVAIGGAHASALPDECLRNGFDLVVVGEAEDEIENIVSQGAFATPQIIECKPLRQLDRLPFPARDLLDQREGWRPFLPGANPTACTASILLSRGCPFKCAFCGPHTAYQRRSIDNVAAELEELRNQQYGNLVILDDLPFLKEQHVEDFCEVLSKHPIPFRCNFRAELLTHRSAAMLAAAGCSRIQIGIESPSQEILNAVKKGASVDKNAEAIAICREHGIKTKAMLIWGLPGDTANTADAIVAWIARHAPDSVQISSFVPLPGSPLWHQGYDRYVTDYQSLSFFNGGEDEAPGIPNGSLSSAALRDLRHSILARLSRITHIDRGLAEDVAVPLAQPCELPTAGRNC